MTDQTGQADGPSIQEGAVINTDDATFHCQTNPPLIIERVKETGEEIHHPGDEAHNLWDQIKHLFMPEEGPETIEDSGDNEPDGPDPSFIKEDE